MTDTAGRDVDNIYDYIAGQLFVSHFFRCLSILNMFHFSRV